MTSEEILQIVDSPFCNHEFNIKRIWWYDTEMNEIVHFVLYLRYLELFCKKYNSSVIVPVISYKIKDHRYSGYGGAQKFRERKLECQKDLFRQVMLCCGWNYGIMKMEEGVPIFPEQVQCTQKEWHEMEKALSGIEILEEDLRYRHKLIICWNFKLARYLQLRNKKKILVASLFSKEDKSICKLVKGIKDSFNIAFGKSDNKCMQERYVLGFKVEGFGCSQPTILDIDYNFCIRIIVLDLLLIKALELFHPKEELGNGIKGNS